MYNNTILQLFLTSAVYLIERTLIKKMFVEFSTICRAADLDTPTIIFADPDPCSDLVLKKEMLLCSIVITN